MNRAFFFFQGGTMKSITDFGRLALAILTVLAVVGLAHATLALYTADGARYVGHWVWNDEGAGTSSVEVHLKAAPPKKPPEKAAPPATLSCIRNFKVVVGALANDGTSVENYALVQLRAGSGREVTIPFDRTLTSLNFIKILAIPIGPQSCPLP
jgi:hypothetical protein